MGASALSDSARAVAIEVLVHGARSRAQLAKQMGLSPATLTRVVRPLLEAGVLVESSAVRTPGRGRSLLPLDVAPERFGFIGIKLTAESIYGVTTDLRIRVLERITVPLRSLSVPAVVTAVEEAAANLQASADVPVCAVGVTVGGRVDAGEVVARSPFLHWRDVPFRALLAERTSVPVYLDNDVTGLTMAQQWFGHGKGCSDFAVLTVGAGVGYGLVVNDALVTTGTNPLSHFPVDPNGPWCRLGHRGCLTAYATSGAMTAAVSAAHGRPVAYEELIRLATGGDPVAARVTREAAYALGRAAAAVTSLTGVRRIILSGEGVDVVSVAHEALGEGLTEYDVSLSDHVDPVVRPMDFHEWAQGAAVVAIRATFPWAS